MKEGNSTYFAAEPNAEACARRCEEQFEKWLRWNKEVGRTHLIRKSFATIYGATINGTGNVSWRVTPGGEQGEQLFSFENHYASISENLHTLTTSNRPVVQCGSANTDYKSLSQALLANGIAEQYLTERELETLLKDAVKSAIDTTEGHILVEWDSLAGEPIGPNPQHLEEVQAGARKPQDVAMVKAGDVKYTPLGPLDVARDPKVRGFDKLPWVITRSPESKFELAAKYPELSGRILALAPTEDERAGSLFLGRAGDYESDQLYVYTLFCFKSAAMPQGRILRYLTGGIVLLDAPIPYDDNPVKRIFPGTLKDTSCGHSQLLHLLGPQDTVNALDSAITTNQLGRGIGNMLVPEGANIQVDKISTSMNEITYSGDKEPKPLEFPATPAELFNYKQEKIRAMEVLSGVNSVVRGSPSESVGADSSGAKLALIEAQAIRSNSGLDASRADLIRDVILATIYRLRDFGGDVRRLAKIAGKANQYMVKEFTSQDLSDIDRVTVDVGNPAMRTVAGKMAVADKLREVAMQAGRPLSPEQYLFLVKTSTYEPLIEGEQTTQMRIRAENEALMEGLGTHRALIADPHWTEIPQHLSVLDNPALREETPENEAIIQGTLDAVQEHIDWFKAMPPELVAMRGGPEALALWQQVQAAIAPPVVPGAPGAPVSPGQVPPSGADQVTNPEASRPEQPGMPGLPSNPSLVEGEGAIQ